MADLKINSHDWDGLSAEDQNKIVGILRDSGLIGADDHVVGDPDEPPVSELLNQNGT